MLNEAHPSPIESKHESVNNKSNPFQSFWMAGYECSDQLNASGKRVDFLNITGHLQLIDQDYTDLSLFNIKTVREGIRWSKVELQPYHYDWSTVQYMMERGKANSIQQIWDICHFGFPADLNPLHPSFIKRFTSLCRAFVRFYRRIEPNQTLIITPINEVSFLSWLGGEEAKTTPYLTGKGWEIKYSLMKAYIEGSRAMLEEDPRIRFLTTEPLVNIVPPLNATPQQVMEADALNIHQFQAVDMLCGRLCPELGGSPEFLDMLGFNFYYNNQWVTGFQKLLPWLNQVHDSRWLPFRQLLKQAYLRYKQPVVITETSHPQEDRPVWIDFITKECYSALHDGIPLWGICLYPIIDRPDWDDLKTWHRSGLWDLQPNSGGSLQRVLHKPYAKALLNVQKMIKV
jgi:hypothetical protein